MRGGFVARQDVKHREAIPHAAPARDSHTQHLPIAIDTNLLPAPFSTVTLANGQQVSYRNWNTTAAGADPLGGVEGLPCDTTQCFVNPLIVQNNQYSSESYAVYEGRYRRNYETLQQSLLGLWELHVQ